MKVLTEADARRKLKSLPGWKIRGTAIRKVYKKKDFVQAMGFVQSVALLAEKMDHHPDIDIRWNTITLVLSTHSKGGITQKDIALAQQIHSLK
ncbi:MAG: 4a-hydroxytetrahydrobiopterin dehydratase [Bacteroidota bacterium]